MLAAIAVFAVIEEPRQSTNIKVFASSSSIAKTTGHLNSLEEDLRAIAFASLQQDQVIPGQTFEDSMLELVVKAIGLPVINFDIAEIAMAIVNLAKLKDEAAKEFFAIKVLDPTLS